MNNNIRNILAVLVGLAIGSYINMYLVMKGPVPEGFDINRIVEFIPLFEAKHFVMPIVGHAVGTLVGAVIASLIAATHKFRFALVIGVFFFVGGIANAIMLHFPILPAAIDLALAYFPMAIIGGYIGGFLSKKINLDLNQDYYDDSSIK